MYIHTMQVAEILFLTVSLRIRCSTFIYYAKCKKIFRENQIFNDFFKVRFLVHFYTMQNEKIIFRGI